MARTVTLSTLRSEFRARGDYNRSAVFSDSVVNGYINRAAAKLYDLLTQTQLDYYTTTTELSTVADTESVALPADFYKLRGLDYKQATNEFIALKKMQLKERNRWRIPSTTVYGPLYRYRIQAGNIILSPVPTGVDTLRLLYVPHYVDFTGDSDTFDTINDYDDLIVERALLYADQREQRPLQERLAMIGKLEQEVKDAADGRDSSEPEYLADVADELEWGW